MYETVYLKFPLKFIDKNEENPMKSYKTDLPILDMISEDEWVIRTQIAN